jgi:CheY-like chemotaxis protein
MDRNPKILIADDDDDSLQAYSYLLKSEGYDVLTASTGSECLRFTREERPDLILLDVKLPDISGIEVCRQIKADPELANILVIHISGIEISSDSQVSGLESGADSYITKPIQYRKLLAQIQALLRIKNDVSSLMLDQQKREFDLLEELSSLPRPSIVTNLFGTPPLRKNLPEIFERLVQLYSEMLDLALQQRAYKVEHSTAHYLHKITDQLGFLKAGPRDVVDIHRAAIKRKAARANLLKTQAYVDEGRMRLVELMGYLVSYYRNRSLGTSTSGSSEDYTNTQSESEHTNE